MFSQIPLICQAILLQAKRLFTFTPWHGVDILHFAAGAVFDLSPQRHKVKVCLTWSSQSIKNCASDPRKSKQSKSQWVNSVKMLYRGNTISSFKQLLTLAATRCQAEELKGSINLKLNSNSSLLWQMILLCRGDINTLQSRFMRRWLWFWGKPLKLVCRAHSYRGYRYCPASAGLTYFCKKQAVWMQIIPNTGSSWINTLNQESIMKTRIPGANHTLHPQNILQHNTDLSSVISCYLYLHNVISAHTGRTGLRGVGSGFVIYR